MSEPLFDIGDNVIVQSPYKLEYPEQEVIHGVIENVGYVSDLGLYVYRLKGLGEWYNENWLDFDMFLPMTIEVGEEITKEELAGEAVDDLLDELNDYKRLEKAFGGEEYSEKVEEIKRRIAGIIASSYVIDT